MVAPHVGVHFCESQTQKLSSISTLSPFNRTSIAQAETKIRMAFHFHFHRSPSTGAGPTILHSHFLQCEASPEPLRVRACIGFHTQMLFLLRSWPPTPFSGIETRTPLQYFHSKQFDQHVRKTRFH